MKDQTRQTQTTMNPGIDASLSKVKSRQMQTTPIDGLAGEPFNLGAEIMDLKQRIEVAKIEGDADILEAPAEVINKISQGALDRDTRDVKWITYNGIIICPTGQTEAVRDYMDQTHEQKAFGANAPGRLIHEENRT